jgi:hypothetical protein
MKTLSKFEMVKNVYFLKSKEINCVL